MNPAFEQAPSVVLWNALPALLASPPGGDTGGDLLLEGVTSGWRGSLLSTADIAMQRAETTLRWGMSLPVSIGQQQMRRVRGELLLSFAELRAAGQAALREGALAAGDALLILANRVAQAIAALAEGYREAWDEFIGVPPALVAIGGAAFFLAAILAVTVLAAVVVNPGALGMLPKLIGGVR